MPDSLSVSHPRPALTEQATLAARAQRSGRLNSVSLAERAASILSFLLVLLGGSSFAGALRMVWIGYTPVPSWDEWFVLIRFAEQEQSDSSLWKWVWEQNNEHRIVLQKLLLLFNINFFAGSEWIMLAAIFVTQCLLCALLVWWLKRMADLCGWEYRAAAGLIAFCVFCPSQWDNFTWGFQLSFVLVNLLFAFALTALLLYGIQFSELGAANRKELVISLSCACLATFCNGNGPLVWPILLVTALLLQLPRRIALLYAAVGIGVIALYFHGYVKPGHHASPLHSLAQPLALLEYLEKYFGGSLVPGNLLPGSFVPGAHLAWGLQVGEVGLTIALGLTPFLFRRVFATKRPFAVGMLAFMAYVGLTAFITALGRIDFGSDQAFSSRYQSYALLFWLCFALLGWMYLSISKRFGIQILLMAVIASLLASTLPSYKGIGQLVRERKNNLDLAGIALLEGLHDNGLLSRIWIRPDSMWPTVEYLKQHQLSLFAGKSAQQLAHPFSENYKISSSEQCLGYIDINQAVGNGPRAQQLAGWAANRSSLRPVERIIIVRDGLIVGYGISGYPRPDVAAALHSVNPYLSGWIGFFVPVPASSAVEVYGAWSAYGRQQACKIGDVETASPTPQ